jgi:hypothetical protein
MNLGRESSVSSVYGHAEALRRLKPDLPANEAGKPTTLVMTIREVRASFSPWVMQNGSDETQ